MSAERVKHTPEQLIADWREAYIAANGTEAPYSIVYQKGWYRLGVGNTKLRRWQLVDATNRLLMRSKALGDHHD